MIIINPRYFLLAASMLCLGGRCTDPDTASIQTHATWYVYNETEEDLPKDQSLITKLGWQRIRFHLQPDQKLLSGSPELPRDDNNMVEVNQAQEGHKAGNVLYPHTYVWLSPSFYGVLTQDAFPKTVAQSIKYTKNCPHTDTKKSDGGLPVHFMDDLIQLEANADVSLKAMTLIISTGINSYLGSNHDLHERLKQEKKAGTIAHYVIASSKGAIMHYNRLIKEGKAAAILIHTAG